MRLPTGTNSLGARAQSADARVMVEGQDKYATLACAIAPNGEADI